KPPFWTREPDPDALTAPYLRPPSPPGRRCRVAADEGGSASASPTPHPAFGHPLPLGEGAAWRRMRGAAPRPVPPLTRPSATLSPWEKVPRGGGGGGQRLGQSHPAPGPRTRSPPGRRCRVAAAEGGSASASPHTLNLKEVGLA